MAKVQSALNSEEYRVRFWFTNSKGFGEQQTRSYFFSNKNSHDRAIKECRTDMTTEGKKIDNIISCTYC